MSMSDWVSSSMLQSLGGAVRGAEVSSVSVARGRLAAGGGRCVRTWNWVPTVGWHTACESRQAHKHGVTCIGWSPAGALLASAGVDGVVRLWAPPPLSRDSTHDAESVWEDLPARGSLAAPGAESVRALTWLDSLRLAIGHDDGAARIWSARGELLAVLHAHEGSLHALAAPCRGAILLTACTQGVLKLHDMAEIYAAGCEGPKPPTLSWVDGAHDLGALCAIESPDGALVATGGHDARLAVWSIVRGGKAGKGVVLPFVTLDGHESAITGVQFSRSRGGRILASCSLDRTARLWALTGEEGVADSGAGECLLLLHAHPRYLTCLALDPDLKFLVTGSNDKSIRMWSLGSLTLDDALTPQCVALQHFALGDLEGIGPVATPTDDADSNGPADSLEATLLYELREAHEGAINSLSCWDNLVATASSDGFIRVFTWLENEEGYALTPRLEIPGHQYPAMSAAWGADGQVILSAGLDGRAVLWDVETGACLRSLHAGGVPGGAAGAVGGGGGCGGVRGAAVSSRRPALLLLATDDYNAPCWTLADNDPNPMHVFNGSGSGAAIWSVAWSKDGKLAATGSADAGGGGALTLHAEPPVCTTLHCEPAAHDNGVEDVSFSPSVQAFGLPDDSGYYALATAGGDELIKLWLVHYIEDENGGTASVRLLSSARGHGGGACSVRWSKGGGALATGGGDGWARVWRSRPLKTLLAIPAAGMGGVPALDFMERENDLFIILGSLDGTIATWRLPDSVRETAAGDAGSGASCSSYGDEEDEDEGGGTRVWRGGGVARWIKDYVTRAPGFRVSPEREAALLATASTAELNGQQLLDLSVEEIMDMLGFGENTTEVDDDEEEKQTLRSRLLDELTWLRREPSSPELERLAPHALLCPVSHALLQEPARAADGFTYDRQSLHEWFLAAGPVSAVSGARLASLRVKPNYRLRDALKDFLQTHSSII